MLLMSVLTRFKMEVRWKKRNNLIKHKDVSIVIWKKNDWLELEVCSIIMIFKYLNISILCES